MLDLLRSVPRCATRWLIRFAAHALAPALVAAAGLVAPCAAADQVIIYRNTDFPGNDLRDGVLPGRSFDECAEACYADQRCVAFTSANGACYKKSRAWPRQANLSNSGFIASRGVPPPGGEGQTDFRPPPISPPGWRPPMHWVNRYDGTDFPGNDLNDLRRQSDSFEDCAQVCASDRRCQAFSWGARDRRCYPKSAASPPKANSGVISGILRSSGMPDRPNPSPAVNRYDRTDLPGNDLTDLRRDTNSFEECAAVCASDRRCTAFAWGTRDQRCYPKYAPSVPKPDSDVISGILRSRDPGSRPPPPQRVTRYDDTDFPGNDLNDLRRNVDSFEECAAVCASDRRCKAFAFGTNDRRCYPKSSASVPKPDSDVISGILRR